MADIQVSNEADELAVAMVQALARQDGDQALAIGAALGPAITDRPSLLARHMAWTAQAHLLRGEHTLARASLKRATALAEASGDAAALPGLRKLATEIFQAKASAAAAKASPLPDTLVGRALAAIDTGNFKAGTDLALAARSAAKAGDDAREEVLALLALARVPGRADGAVKAAHAVADASSDKNLVTAVARAARAAGIEIPKQVF
jgi:hypothetical protein